MCKCLMPSNRQNSLNRIDSNWRPWSVLIRKGTPKRDIHVERRAEATIAASTSAMGKVSRLTRKTIDSGQTISMALRILHRENVYGNSLQTLRMLRRIRIHARGWWLRPNRSKIETKSVGVCGDVLRFRWLRRNYPCTRTRNLING